jgi:hypothetical protein
MSGNMTKGLQTNLFHRHTDFILGHVPQMYSPVYDTIVGRFCNHTLVIDNFVPPSFTTPLTAAAVWVHAPIFSDYKHNPWLVVIGHGQYNPLFSSSSHSLCSQFTLYQTVDCGGVISDRLPDLTISLDSVLYVFKYGNSGKICKQPVSQWVLAIRCSP